MLSLQDFSPEVGCTLTVSGQAMQLVSATALRHRAPPEPGAAPEAQGRPGFSLLFRDQAGAAVLPQGMHRIEHPRLGELELFLVPMGDRPPEYEAIFN